MGTRANVVVTYGLSTIYIYRHFDGYLAETGADILERLQAAMDAPAFVRSLLSEMYEKQSYDTQPRPIYRLTTALHGDIEHIYRIDFSESDEGYRISYAARPDWNDESWVDNPAQYSVAEFASTVKAERAARYAELKLIA